MPHAPHTKEQTFPGFVVTKHLLLSELNSTLIELVHERTGACVLHIANDDPENVFCLSFQTLPDSSNGVAHILEHLVLCGSKNFPVKDPFFAMNRRSMNTYMNALTGQDFTCYPASSLLEKDFYNLLDVYLDAAFRPELRYLSFLQEGHRLAFSEGIDSPLQVKGVVYNEMKGAMASSDQRLWFSLFKYLMPDLPYAHNSGGTPKEIVNLTYEELLEFHKTFYHPSRCLFFFYGDLPLKRHLAFLEDKILAHPFHKAPLIKPLPLQKRFTCPVIAKENYPISSQESPDGKTIVALGWLTAPIAKQADILGLSLLDSLLTDTDVSPLTRALLKAGVCTQVESAINPDMSEVPWVLICKGCSATSAKEIRKITKRVFQAFTENPIPEEEIEASLHQLEFQRTEIGGDGVPFGLTLFFRAALSKQHGGEANSALLIHSLFQELRERLQDPDYLPSLIRKYFLENSHFVELTMLPDPTLEKREREEEEDFLRTVREELSSEDAQALLQREKDLLFFQEQIENQSLECLPKIEISEVEKHAKDYPLQKIEQPFTNVFHLDCFTNQIIYADLSFDLPEFSSSDLPLLVLFSRFLTEVGIGEKNYEETLKEQQAQLGGISTSLSLHIQSENSSLCKPTLTLRAKALPQNGPALFSLLRETAISANFNAPDRIQELLQEIATHLHARLPKQAMNYAVHLALSSFGGLESIYNEWAGLPFYQRALDWAHHPDQIPLLIDHFQRFQRSIFASSRPDLVLTCQATQYDSLSKSLSEWDPTLSAEFTPWKTPSLVATVSRQARLIASPVAFTVLAFKTVGFSSPYAPALLIATDLMENVILHKEIREKGGAYGSGATYSPITGHFHFYSYRDPHLSNTYFTFLRAIEQIAQGNFSERELEEAKLGILQDLDAPLCPGQRASTAYSWYRAGRTYELRDAYRAQLISISKKDVQHAVSSFLLNQIDQGAFVTFGGQELLEKEGKKLPFDLPIYGVKEPCF